MRRNSPTASCPPSEGPQREAIRRVGSACPGRLPAGGARSWPCLLPPSLQLDLNLASPPVAAPTSGQDADDRRSAGQPAADPHLGRVDVPELEPVAGARLGWYSEAGRLSTIPSQPCSRVAPAAPRRRRGTRAGPARCRGPAGRDRPAGRGAARTGCPPGGPGLSVRTLTQSEFGDPALEIGLAGEVGKTALDRPKGHTAPYCRSCTASKHQDPPRIECLLEVSFDCSICNACDFVVLGRRPEDVVVVITLILIVIVDTHVLDP